VQVGWARPEPRQEVIDCLFVAVIGTRRKEEVKVWRREDGDEGEGEEERRRRKLKGEDRGLESWERHIDRLSSVRVLEAAAIWRGRMSSRERPAALVAVLLLNGEPRMKDSVTSNAVNGGADWVVRRTELERTWVVMAEIRRTRARSARLFSMWSRLRKDGIPMCSQVQFRWASSTSARVGLLMT